MLSRTSRRVLDGHDGSAKDIRTLSNTVDVEHSDWTYVLMSFVSSHVCGTGV